MCNFRPSFWWTPKVITFNSWLSSKYKPNTKENHILCESVFTWEAPSKQNQVCKQKRSLLFKFCNIFDLLTFRTEKIVWWTPIFKPDFYIFSYNKQLKIIYRNFIDKFLLYHTSLRVLLRPLEDIICFTFIRAITGGHIYSDHGRKLPSLPAKVNGFFIQIKAKRERRYRNTSTQLQSRMNGNEKRLNTIPQEKWVSKWVSTSYPIAIKFLILLSNNLGTVLG